jgi:hypothetical protein
MAATWWLFFVTSKLLREQRREGVKTSAKISREVSDDGWDEAEKKRREEAEAFLVVGIGILDGPEGNGRLDQVAQRAVLPTVAF